jgi:hypothetical protein
LDRSDRNNGFEIASGSYITQQITKLLLARKGANTKANRDSLARMEAKTDANHKKMMAKMRTWREERTTVREARKATDKKANPEEMESALEHREVSKEDSIVKSVKGRKTRHRGRKITTGRRAEPKELTRGDCGSRMKSAVSYRKVSCRVTVARCKRNVFRKIRTQGNCGPRKEFAVVSRKMTRSTKVAQRKGHGLQGRSRKGPSVEQGRRKNQTMNEFARGTRKGRTLARRKLMRQQSTNGTRNRDFEEQVRFGSERIICGIYRKVIGLEIVKRAVGISSGSWKIRNWSLCRGRSPPKRKKNLVSLLAMLA